MPGTLQNRFLNLMVQQGAIKAWSKSSTDGYGSPVFSSVATTYHMRFTYERKADWGKDGLVTVNMPVAYLATTATIDVRSRLVFQGTTYRILAVKLYIYPGASTSAVTPHHVKLELEGG